VSTSIPVAALTAGGGAGGQLGVDDRDVGEQVHVPDLLFDARLGVLDDTPVADLAAGAGRRREVDARRRLVRDVAASLEVEDVAVVGRQYRRRLGRVQRGAAADSEEQVAPERFERVDRLVYDRVCGVGDHPVVDLVLAARLVDRFEDGVEHPGVANAFVRDDENATRVERLEIAARFARRPGAEQHAIRSVPHLECVYHATDGVRSRGTCITPSASSRFSLLVRRDAIENTSMVRNDEGIGRPSPSDRSRSSSEKRSPTSNSEPSRPTIEPPNATFIRSSSTISRTASSR
jgi:hypothetical protein